MKKLPKLLRKKHSVKESAPSSAVPLNEAPRITNETVTEHREEVLSRARKYIYPLQHSKHKIVLITTSILIAAIVFFFGYCVVALYSLKSNSSFLYGVTRVIPFPVAKTGSGLVAYENYLFELRHYLHYYETQQRLDFNSEIGKQQLSEYKKRALNRVVDDAYIKKLASQKNVKVSDQEVDDEVRLQQMQNRLGGSDKVFEDVLKEFWGWSINDFKRSLRSQLLAQKVAIALDPETKARSEAALSEIKAGADFGAIAKKYSDDVSTKDSGGDFGFLIDKTNRDLSARTTDALYKLKPGQVSEVINNGYGLEIVKVTEVQGEKVRAAHIVFNIKDVNRHINELKDKQKTRTFIKL